LNFSQIGLSSVLSFSASAALVWFRLRRNCSFLLLLHPYPCFYFILAITHFKAMWSDHSRCEVRARRRGLPAQMSARSPSGPVMAASLRSVLPRTYGTAPSLVPNFRISIGIGEKGQFCWKYICLRCSEMGGNWRVWGLDTQWSVVSGRWSAGSFRLSAGRERRRVTGDREGKSPP
jgi:hypothetical protein